MRLIPKTLSGRLILIFLVGLLLTQIVATAILLKDRGRVLSDRAGIHMFSRIGNILTLLEELPEKRWEHVVSTLDSATLQVWLDDQAREAEAGTIEGNRQAAVLKRLLPYDTDVRVYFSPPRPEHMRRHRVQNEHPPHSLERPRWRQRPPHHLGVHVQVKAADGRWINFRRPLADRFAHWPEKVLAYLALLLVSAIVLSMLAVRLLTRPLKTLAGAAEGLGRDMGQDPLPESGSSEVAAASRAFNTMQQRLLRYIQGRSRILAAVSHDLKTPITRLRLRTEMLQDPPVKDKFNQDLDEMELMVTASLEFLRGSESNEQQVRIDIPALLESLKDDMEEVGLKVRLDLSDTAPFTGRPNLLKRCLANLVENAARYGEEARIQVRDTASQLVISVFDKGPGVPESELENLFRPFYRLGSSRDESTGGTGLGLGIARNIARAHGGDVTLHLPASGGLEARVILPR